MNMKPVIRTAVFVLLSLACAFAILLLGTAIVMRSDDPASRTAFVGYAALFGGAVMCGILCGTESDSSLFLCGLCGGASYAAVITLVSLFFSGGVGVWIQLLLTACCVLVTTSLSCLRAIPTKHSGKSRLRKKYIRKKR